MAQNMNIQVNLFCLLYSCQGHLSQRVLDSLHQVIFGSLALFWGLHVPFWKDLGSEITCMSQFRKALGREGAKQQLPLWVKNRAGISDNRNDID